MTLHRPGPSRYQSLQASGRALARTAPLVRFGLFAVGVSLFLDQVRPLASDAQFTWGERRVMGVVAIITLGGFGLAGWVLGRLVRAAADLIEVFVDGTEAAVRTCYLIEAKLVPGLVVASAALERLAEGDAGDRPGRAVGAVRRAIHDGRWGRAEQLLQALGPDVPEAGSLGDELSRARQVEKDDLLARLDAGRAADDPERVIHCRDALTRHLRGDPLKELDRRVVRWLAALIDRRAGSGDVTPELAELARRVADSFGDTPEGAAIEAGLPALKRRAGLCPGCSRPYRGPDVSCPDCRRTESPPMTRSGGVSPGREP